MIQTRFKQFLLWAVPVAVLLFFGKFFWDIHHNVKIDPAQWSLFFNAEMPKALLGVSLILIPQWIIDFAYRGHTIRTLTHIHDESSEGDKWRSLLFLLGNGLLCLVAAKGTFLFT